MENCAKSFTIYQQAKAKINLSLDIVGRRGDYHLLDSVVAEINISDNVYINPRSDRTINVKYFDNLSFENDTARKAAQFIIDKFNTNGADILIQKNIPIGYGLGGSSADAAAVARGMACLYGLDIEPHILAEIGADVPFMFVGGCARISGIGEIIQKLDIRPLHGVLLIVADCAVSTGQAFSMYDKIGGEGIDIDKFITDFENPKNALFDAACHVNPRVKEAFEVLSPYFKNVVLSGSGGGVVAYDKDKKIYERALKALKNTLNENMHIYTFDIGGNL